MTGFFTAPRIAWGPGAIEQLSGLDAHRAVVAVDHAVEGRDGARRITEELAKTDCAIEVVGLPEAPDRVDRIGVLAERLTAFAPDWLVVVGGGRAIDASKAARLVFERPGLDLRAALPGLDLDGPHRLRLAAVPTTSGSGSEASATADLWTAEGVPFEFAHRALTPEWALLDPAFAASLSPDLLLDGGFEIAVQALEAYLSAWANPLSDALAVDALATVLERLPHALRWSEDPDAKAALHYAATAAGLAASNAQRGVGHALARALSGPTGLSYGRLLGLLFLPVLEFDRPSARDRLEALTTAVLRGENPVRTPLATRWGRLLETFRCPATLPAAGVDTSRLAAVRDQVIAHALGSPAVLANPRVPSSDDLGSFLDRIQGARSP